MDRVFFTNSEAKQSRSEKLARKYYYKKHGASDSQIIAMRPLSMEKHWCIKYN